MMLDGGHDTCRVDDDYSAWSGTNTAEISA